MTTKRRKPMTKRTVTKRLAKKPSPAPPTPIFDGGQAFPVSMDWLKQGMTLRDWFAGQAVTGQLSNARVMDTAIDDWTERGGPRPICVAEWIAGLAYEVADKMLQARKHCTIADELPSAELKTKQVKGR